MPTKIQLEKLIHFQIKSHITSVVLSITKEVNDYYRYDFRIFISICHEYARCVYHPISQVRCLIFAGISSIRFSFKHLYAVHQII